MNERLPQPAQLELPQISLARYFDLLKRRRWQVIPITLLGLMVGGLVAFFIPRYYVARARLEYARSPIETAESAVPLKDPFEYVVDFAAQTMPMAVGQTMRDLGWPESTEPDPFLRVEHERAVQQRLQVDDVNPRANRPYAWIDVSYRDQDGTRAKAFLEQLVTTWVKERLTQMRRQADGAEEEANERARLARREYDEINDSQQQLASRHGIRYDLPDPVRREQMQLEALAREALRAELLEAEIEVTALEAELAQLQADFDATPNTGQEDSGARLPVYPPGSPEALYQARLLQLENSLESMGPLYPHKAAYERNIARLRKLLAAAGGGGAAGQTSRLAQLHEAIAAKEVELAKAREKVRRLEDRLAEETEAARRRDLAYSEFLKNEQLLEEARTRRDAAMAELAAAQKVQSQLTRSEPIAIRQEVTVPTRPTEPNLLLVAGLGSLIGLGLAIGLILLVDSLQGTLKTVDDVERALPVPVLGTIGHMDTDEERVRTVAGRRRASLVAGAVLFCGVVVVTVYHVAPERLPPFARDLLMMVLGD